MNSGSSLPVNGSVIHRDNLVKKMYTFDFVKYNRVSNIKIIHLVLDLVLTSLNPITFINGSKIKLDTSAVLTVYSETRIILDYCIKLYDFWKRTVQQIPRE